MGVVIAVIAIAGAIGNYIAGNIVQDLKDQVQAIIDLHKPDMDNVTKLKELLEKLDMKNLNQSMNKMGKESSQTLTTLLTDQQVKLNLLQKVEIQEQKDQKTSIFKKVLNLFSNALNVVLSVDVLVGPQSGPIGWATLAALTTALSAILGIFQLIGNIKEIEELKKKENRLNEYFKEGGQFQEVQKQLRELSLELSENFHIFVITFRSMINEKYASVTMVSLLNNNPLVDYQSILKELANNPFTPAFQSSAEKLALDMKQADKQPDMGKKLTNFVKLLTSFEQIFNIDTISNNLAALVSKFDEKTELSIAIKLEMKEMTQVTKYIDHFVGDFATRETYSLEEKKQMDAKLYKNIFSYIKLMINPDDSQEPILLAKTTMYVALTVAFYTDKFYGDNQIGDTLLHFNLKYLNKKASLITYIGSQTNQVNSIALPEPPKFMKDHQPWMNDKARLSNSLFKEVAQKQKIDIKVAQTYSEFQNMYIRFIYSEFIFNKVSYLRLNINKGVYYTFTINEKPIIRNYEEDFYGNIESDTKFMNFMAPQAKNQQFTYSSSNLENLAHFGCMYVNGGIFLNKLKNIVIDRIGDAFQLTVQSLNIDFSPEYAFKFLSSFIVKGQDEAAKKGYYQKKLQEQGKKILSISQMKDELVFWLID